MYRDCWGVNVRFFGVGQGLFSSGEIRTPIVECSSMFRWVYDCGTTSEQSLVDNAIEVLIDEASSVDDGRPYLDLVVISHFDRDHISGLVRLLERFEVGDLLLPYVPLWKRLSIAFQLSEGPRSLLVRFLLDPVEFISQLPGVAVKRILFTLSAEQPADAPPADPRIPVSPEEREGSTVSVQIQKHVFSDLNVAQDQLVDNEDLGRHLVNGVKVEYLAVGSAIVVAQCWEFVPYNDEKLAHLATLKFRVKVEKLRNNLLLTTGRREREKALKALKACYDLTLGGGKESRNVISLFMYAGPILSCSERVYSRSFSEVYVEGDDCSYSHSNMRLRKGGVLYTGDGYINNICRLSSLQSYLTLNRFSQIHTLQVMHHGARDNWFEDLAEKINPHYSLFSSDPGHKRYKHPDAAVLRDFWSYGPLQVDKETTVTFEFEYRIIGV